MQINYACFMILNDDACPVVDMPFFWGQFISSSIASAQGDAVGSVRVLMTKNPPVSSVALAKYTMSRLIGSHGPGRQLPRYQTPSVSVPYLPILYIIVKFSLNSISCVKKIIRILFYKNQIHSTRRPLLSFTIRLHQINLTTGAGIIQDVSTTWKEQQ